MLLVLIRPAQRGEHRALRGCETRRGGQRFADERMDSVLLRRRAEGQHRAAYPDLIPVVQVDSTGHPPSVDERAVARQPVVIDRPHTGHILQRGMHPRDERVAIDDHVRADALPSVTTRSSSGQRRCCACAPGRIVRRVARRAGLAQKISPHTCGTRFITAALDAGVPLRDVQEAASHADPRTTMRYDGRRVSLDRHATYVVAAYLAGAAR